MGAIRLFLALAVVQGHIHAQFLLPAHLNTNGKLALGVNAGYAVAFFFVISGFLISFVLEEKYARPGGVAAFYRARALRIYPLWWCLYLIVPFVTGGGLWQFAASRHFYDLLSGFFLLGSDWLLSFAAYPEAYTAPTPHGLEPGWSLAAEMTFYLFAPFVLRSRILPLLILAASVVVRTVLVGRFPQTGNLPVWNSWCYYFFPSIAFYFMLGHLGRQFHKSFSLPAAAGWVGLAVAVLLCVIQDGNYPYDNAYFFLAIVVFAMSLPAIFNASKDNRVCNVLGDLTYPLYLVHGTVLALLAGSERVRQAVYFIADGIPGHRPLFVFAKAAVISATIWIAALLAAGAVHFAIEKPAIGACRRGLAMFDRARPRPTQPATP